MRYQGWWGLLGLLVLVPAVGGQERIETRGKAFTATTSSASHTWSLPLKAMLVCNNGAARIFINTDGTGVASADGTSEKNVMVEPGECFPFNGGQGEQLQTFGYIAASGSVAFTARGDRSGQ